MFSSSIYSTACDATLLCAHIHLFSSDWQGPLRELKHINYISICSFSLFASFIQRSLHFLVKSFLFLFLFLCYSLLGIINFKCNIRNKERKFFYKQDIVQVKFQGISASQKPLSINKKHDVDSYNGWWKVNWIARDYIISI